jgi:hypothetical protein
VMPLDRMPSISLGIIVHVGAGYDASYHWRTELGELRAAVGFDAGGQAMPTSKAHLVDAADQAESADDPANVAAVVVRGVAG